MGFLTPMGDSGGSRGGPLNLPTVGGGMMDFMGGKNRFHAEAPDFRKYDYGGALDNAIYSYDPTREQESSQWQGDFIRSLQARSRGEGPSMAGEQYKKALATGQEQQAGALASSKGINPAMAARLIGQQGAGYNQAAALNYGQLKVGEQLGAEQLLGQALAQKRQQDQARMGIDINRLSTLGSLSNAQESLGVQSKLGPMGINANVAAQNASTEKQYAGAAMKMIGDMMSSMMSGGGMAGGGGGGGGGGGAAGGMGMLAMMSDEDQKTEVSSGNNEIAEFLSALKANKYKYKKSAGQDDKKHISPMAQEMEESGAGSEMVVDSPKGKMIDYGKSGPAILASLAYLNEQVEELKENKLYTGGRPKDFTDGGEVPGKAKVSGDSEDNDTVHAMLSPDEIVLPRTVAMDETGESAKEFVRALSGAVKSRTSTGYGSVLAAKKACGGRV